MIRYPKIFSAAGNANAKAFNGAQINWNQYICRGLSLCILVNSDSPLELVSGQRPTQLGTRPGSVTFRGTQFGMGAEVLSGAAANQAWGYPNRTLFDDCTNPGSVYFIGGMIDASTGSRLFGSWETSGGSGFCMLMDDGGVNI